MKDPINKLKIEIIEEYNNTFGSVISYDISAVAEAIHKKIFLLLEESLYLNTAKLIENSSHCPNSFQNRILYEGEHFVVRCQEPFDDPQSIIVAYLNLNASNRKLSKSNSKEIKINGIGKYKNLTLISPSSFPLKWDLILNILKTIFETSYSWLFQKIKYTIHDNYMFSSVLYSRIKISLTNNEEIYKSIWFVIKDNDKCIILLDKENIIGALEKLNETAIHPDVGPYKLLDEFINMRLPFEKAFALQALKSGACVNGIIDKGKYADELPLLASSQIKVFTSEVSVYPILTDWKTHLYVSFPTIYRKIVEPIIELNKAKLIEDFKNLDSRIKKMLDSMKKQNFEVERIAEFLGSFAASYTKSFLKE